MIAIFKKNCFFFFRNLDKLKEGISDKIAVFVYLLMTFIISVVFSFVYGWKLTLVILSCAPVIIVATAFVAKVIIYIYNIQFYIIIMLNLTHFPKFRCKVPYPKKN